MKLHAFTLGSLRIASLESPFDLISQEQLESHLPLPEMACADKFKHKARKDEFLAGRLIAHLQEPKLGPILREENGMPRWPEGYLGSISHKKGRVVVSVASSMDYLGIGIDLEIPSEMPLNILEQVCREEEIFVLKKLPLKDTDALALVFSAKESLFKCCYPPSQTWFGFHDALFMNFDEKLNSFCIKLLKNLPPYFYSGQVFQGTWMVDNWNGQGFMLTAISVAKDL